MPGPTFNFSGLGAIYNQALKEKRETIVFEVQDGIGSFVFMMFFSPHDRDSWDHLYLFLERTNVLLRLKMYGNHPKGDFLIYVSKSQEMRIREELGVKRGAQPFYLVEFFERLNQRIPKALPLVNVIKAMSQRRQLFGQHDDLRAKVDEASKVYLIGPRNLPRGAKPREKTLRKLYLYVDAPSDVIRDFISALKSANKTVAWSDTPGNKTLREIISSV